MNHTKRETFPAIWILTCVLSIILCGTLTHAQYFDAKMNDQKFLDNIRADVRKEVTETKGELMNQAKVIQQLTRNYIGARLKQNLFKALRVLAEKELQIDAMTMQERPRQPRQDEDAGGDDDSDSTKAPSQILPQVANLIKAVFGGNINLTSYVEGAAKFLPRPVGNQLVGVVKLLANNPSHKYTTTTTTTTKKVTTTASTTTTLPTTKPPQTGLPVIILQAVPQKPGEPVQYILQQVAPAAASAAPSPPPPTSTPPPPAPPRGPPPFPAKSPSDNGNNNKDDDEDEEESGSARAKQLSIPGLDILGNIGSSISNFFVGNSTYNSTKGPENSPTETTSAFEEETSTAASNSMATKMKMGGLDVSNLVSEVRSSINDILRVIPDLFNGARGAYKFLGNVNRLFVRLEAEEE